MLVSLNWIKEYVTLPQDLTMDQLAYDLTMRTVEVEDIVDLAESLDRIVAGTILEVKAHPQADRLRITTLDVGQAAPVQIVCGGSNLYQGQSIVAALPGSQVRWHGEGDPVTIEATQLRGVDSYGMICSASEVAGLDLLFPPEAEAEILDITEFKAQPGTPIAQVLGLDDWILEIDNKSMTNRPDLWGHYGLARELAAIYHAPLKPLPTFKKPQGEGIPVAIEADDKCCRYTATTVKGIQVADSPFEIRRRLYLLGMRPINNIVDMTNIAMLLTGEPCHAFDLAKLQGGIRVRRAKDREELLLLDDEKLRLSEEDLVIADEAKALGLAGIMGGKEDSVWPNTLDLILEAASFEAIGIRKTAQRYGLRTEASSRFEKALNTQRVEETLGVLQNLLESQQPQASFTGFTDCQTQATPSPVITVGKAFLAKRLGHELNLDQIKAALEPMGFDVADDKDRLQVTVPSWRATGDVSLGEDILEEIARMEGYENFAFQAPQVTLKAAINQRQSSLDRKLREYLAFQAGLAEVFSYPWVEESLVKALDMDPSEQIRLADPPSPQEAGLRNSLLPGLCRIIDKNLAHFDDFGIFEVTRVFLKGESYSPSAPTEVLPKQPKYAAFALVGQDPVELFRKGKGILEQVPRRIMVEAFDFCQTEKPVWADPKIWLNFKGKEPLGSLGILSMKARDAIGLRHHHALLCEFNLDGLVALPSRDNGFQPLPHYPLVEQDLSLLLDETVRWQDIVEKVKPLAKQVDFVDEYRGPQVPAGQKSLTLRITLGAEDHTLTAQEIEAAMAAIQTALSEAFHTQIRDK